MKPNDRVRIATNLYDSIDDGVVWKGQLGTVVSVDDSYIDVVMDDTNGYEVYEDNIWPFCESELELILSEDSED